MASDDMRHLEHLPAVAEGDVSVILSKEATYQGSWKRAGGRSAWFMMRRNMDRLLTMMERVEFRLRPDQIPAHDDEDLVLDCDAYQGLLKALRSEDLFAMIRSDPSGRDGSVLASLRDLRRYAALVEAEMIAEGHVRPEYGPGDGPGRGPAVAEPDDTIHPGLDPTEQLLDQVLRLICPEWSDETRSQAVSHALDSAASEEVAGSVYDRAAFVTGMSREDVKLRTLQKIYGFHTPAGPDQSLLDVTSKIQAAMSHAVNFAGLDARLNTPDYVLAELLAPLVVKFLAERTDVQMIEQGWEVSGDGEGNWVEPTWWPGFPSVTLTVERRDSEAAPTPVAAPAAWVEAAPDEPRDPGTPADGGHHAPSCPLGWSRDMRDLHHRVQRLFSSAPGYVKVSAVVRGEDSPAEELYFEMDSGECIRYSRGGSRLMHKLSQLLEHPGLTWKTSSIRALRACPDWEAVA